MDLKKLLGECIDYTLYWDYKSELKYQQQGLYDYYFSLRDAEENRNFLGFKRRRKVISQDNSFILNPVFEQASSNDESSV